MIGLTEACVEAALCEFHYDAALEFGDCSEDLEGQDAVVEGHSGGIVAAWWEGEHGAGGGIDQVANGLGGFVAEFSG